MQLKSILKKHSGRDMSGQVVVRHQGGRHKRFYRDIDFRRDKFGIKGKVMAFEYDPNRSTDIALVYYADGEKRYILRPEGLELNDVIMSGEVADVRVGNALPIEAIPVGTTVHNVELTRGKGGQIARSAGNQATILARENEYVHIRLPSGEVRRIFGKNLATIGQLGNIGWKDEVLGKAGASRHRGKRPNVRGVAMSPRSHPHGGGEGRSSVGMPAPKTYAGRIAVGKTRQPKKASNKFIVKRRNAK
jgi:large subunit ribosomal protein L2